MSTLSEQISEISKSINKIDLNLAVLTEHVYNQNGRVHKNELAIKDLETKNEKHSISIVKWVAVITTAVSVSVFFLGYLLDYWLR